MAKKRITTQEDEDERLLLIRDHRHASNLYKLYKSLREEKFKPLYTPGEMRKIQAVIEILQKKEQELTQRHNPLSWWEQGDYSLWR